MALSLYLSVSLRVTRWKREGVAHFQKKKKKNLCKKAYCSLLVVFIQINSDHVWLDERCLTLKGTNFVKAILSFCQRFRSIWLALQSRVKSSSTPCVMCVILPSYASQSNKYSLKTVQKHAFLGGVKYMHCIRQKKISIQKKIRILAQLWENMGLNAPIFRPGTSSNILENIWMILSSF